MVQKKAMESSKVTEKSCCQIADTFSKTGILTEDMLIICCTRMFGIEVIQSNGKLHDFNIVMLGLRY